VAFLRRTHSADWIEYDKTARRLRIVGVLSGLASLVSAFAFLIMAIGIAMYLLKGGNIDVAHLLQVLASRMP